MKVSFLDYFLKTMVKKYKPAKSTCKKPLFIDASFEKNTKSFIKHNRNEKLQPLTVNDLGREINFLRKGSYRIEKKVAKI